MNDQSTKVLLFDRMRLEPDEGIYFLSAGFEKRMSTFAQQNRAISLGGSLLKEHTTGSLRVAIVGAGAAGLTLASMLAWQSQNSEIKVTIFEKEEKPLTTYENTNRAIHCRLYEWPLAHWQAVDGGAALPVMTWSSGTGKKITAELRKQWECWQLLLGTGGSVKSSYPRIRFLEKHKVVKIERKADGLWRVTSQISPSEEGEKKLNIFDAFDIVIIATGPGSPGDPFMDPNTKFIKPFDSWRWDYWNSDEIPDRKLAGNRVLIFGRGDSALTRALEVGFECNLGCPENSWARLDQVMLTELVNHLENLINTDLSLNCFKSQVQEIEETLENALRSAQDGSDDGPQAEKTAWEALQKAGSQMFNGMVTSKIVRRKEVAVHDDGEAQSEAIHRTLPICVSLAYRENDCGLVNGKAFTLHRWLFAQFFRLSWIEFLPGHLVNCLGGIEGEWSLNSLKFDEVYFGIPRPTTEATKFSPEFQAAQFRKNLEHRGIHKGNGVPPRPDSRHREVGKLGSQRFFSDLFDSATQALVFEALQKIDQTTAEQRLIDLYRRRLLLEFVRRDKVVVNDDQLIEGAFFIRWLPEASDHDWKLLSSEHFVVRHRKTDSSSAPWRPIIDSLYSKRDKTSGGFQMRDMEFSALACTATRTAVRKFLNAEPARTFSCLESLRNAVHEHLLSIEPGVKPAEWLALICRHTKLVGVLDRKTTGVEMYCGDLAFLLNNEDLGKFAAEGKDKYLNELLRIFNSENPVQRRSIYPQLQTFREKDQDSAEALKDFYDRACLRAMADQHAATVFETVRMKGLPPYTNVSNNPSNLAVPQVVEEAQLMSETIAFKPPVNPEQLWRLKNETLFSIPPEIRTENALGCTALDVLMGCSSIERRWIEEALVLGPRAPAVVDEEKQGNRMICRVEYSDNIRKAFGI